MGFWGILRTLLEMKTILLPLIFPLALLPILFIVEGDVGRCSYAVLLLILFWVFEVLPLAITSLLPILLFPTLRVLTTRQTAAEYMKSASITVIAIFGIVAAVERWGLHRRIAVGIMSLFGTKPHWLILGVLTSTAVLSITLTSAGATVLMLPIVRGIMEKLKNIEAVNEIEAMENDEAEKVEEDRESDDVDFDVMSELPSVLQDNSVFHENEMARLYKALSLSVAYGSCLGSTVTMTGGPANLMMVGLTETFYEEYGMESPVTFVSWLVFTFPMAVMNVIITWLWLVVLFLRGKGMCRSYYGTKDMTKAQKRLKEHLRQEFKSLGPISYQEAVVVAALVLLVVLFFTKDLYFAPGWGSFFKPGYVGTAVPASVVLVLLFIIPSKSPGQLLTYNPEEDKSPRFEPIVRWNDVSETTPWGLILLFGAAFSLVKAIGVSGLLDQMSVYFETFATLSPLVLTVAVTTLTTFTTECISNTATITMLVPIAGKVANLAGMEPVSLIFPLTLAAKFAFMMPIATVPNATVFALGALQIKDMAIAGFVLNILALISLNIAAHTWGKAYFGWDVLPDQMRLNRTLNGNLTDMVFY